MLETLRSIRRDYDGLRRAIMGMSEYKGRTRADALMSMADKYTTVAVQWIKKGENDLASFYKHAADGFLLRLDELSVEECCEVI